MIVPKNFVYGAYKNSNKNHNKLFISQINCFQPKILKW
jgi:hypothetical protein